MLTRSRRNTQAAQQAPALAPSQTASVFTVSDALLARAAELSATASSLAADLLAAEATLSTTLYAVFPVPSVAHAALATRDFASVEASLYYFLPDTGKVTPPAPLDAAWQDFASLLDAWRFAAAIAASAAYLTSAAAASPASLRRSLVPALATAPRTSLVLVLSEALKEISDTDPSNLVADATVSPELAPDTFEIRSVNGAVIAKVAVPPALLSAEQSIRYSALRSSGLSIEDTLRSL